MHAAPYDRVVIFKNYVDRLIYVRKAYIPNLGPIGPLLHVEKFVVGGGWWWVVVEADFSVKLEPQAEQQHADHIFVQHSHGIIFETKHTYLV